MSPPGPALARIAIAVLVGLAGAAAIVAAVGGSRAGAGPVLRSAGSWKTLANSPLTRTEVGAARIGGFIYVLGGFLTTAETTNQVVRYSIAGGRWQPVAPMPVAVNHPAVTAYRGRLYVYGGYTASFALAAETDALQRFDPAKGTWKRLAGSGFARAAATLAPVGRKLYAIGGAQENGLPLNLVQAFNLEKGKWHGERAMTVAREHLASAVVGGKVFVLGGRASGQNLSVVERFNPEKHRWARLPSMRTARSGFGAAAVKGRVIAVGGEQLAEGVSTIGEVELYRPSRKHWRRLPSMITPRHGVGVAAAGRRVFAAEGGPQPGFYFSSALEAIRLTRRQLGLGRP
jgi:N-acetylneuraminic acid mutarotase